MTLGAALVQMNQPDAAVEQFNLVLKKDPASVTALDWLAKTFITQQRYSSAIALLKTSPADEVLQMDLVIAYSKSGRNDESIRILSQMIKDRPASAVAHSGLATIYTQQNRLEDAIAEFKEALRLGPHNDEIQVSYAKTLILLSDFEAALPVVQEYQRNHPREFQACYLIGVVDRELGKNAEARDMLKQAVRLDPNHFNARYNLGVVLVDLKEPVEARTQFERALQLDPSSNEARFRLANLLRSMGLREEAGRQFEIYQRNSQERAKRDVAVNRANQADQALAKGEIHQAVELYRQAVEEDPQNAHMFYNLALALDRAGDASGEAEALHRAAESDSLLR